MTPRLKPLAVAVLSLVIASVAAAQDRPRVVAVNYPLQYFAERLLDGDAEVVFPVPEDVDPSFWRPGISDISMIQSADLILLNGAGFATWIDRVSLPRSKLVNTTSAIRDRYIATESITHSHGDGGEHSHEGLASYTWLDPTLAVKQAEAVAGAIAGRNLAPPEEVYARFAELQNELEQLDAFASETLQAAQGIAMIATHPRYQYLARRYGLSVASLEWEAGALPSDDELNDLRALAADTGARVLIWEADPPAAAIEAATALGLESATFPPLAHQPSDGDFLTAFRAALTALSSAGARTAEN